MRQKDTTIPPSNVNEFEYRLSHGHVLIIQTLIQAIKPNIDGGMA